MRKGYVFTLDAIIAIFMLVIGLMVMYYYFAEKNNTIYFTEQISQDVVGVLAQTRVSDLCVDPTGPGCRCANYPQLQAVICRDPQLTYSNSSLLAGFAEMIVMGTRDTGDVEDVIHEIFVTRNIIDERRLGFSVMYTDMDVGSSSPLELYNTETYHNP